MTCYGHYIFFVMSFCLTYTHATFIDLINKLFKLYLNMFVIVFSDDIFIYSRNEEHHVSHLRIVPQAIKDREFNVEISKC